MKSKVKSLRQRFIAHRSQLIHFGFLTTLLLVLLSFSQILSPIFWPFELTSHFHFQYALLFLCLVVFWISLKKSSLIVLATFGFLINFIFILPFYFQPTANALDSNMTNTKSLSLIFDNFNFMNDHFDRLIHYINQKNPQVVAIVELPENHYQTLKTKLSHYPYSFHASGQKQLGLAVFSQLPFNRRPYVHYFGNANFPTIEVNFGQSDQQVLSLLVVHAPPPISAQYFHKRNQLFDDLANYLTKKQTRTIVVGDFNSTLWSPNFSHLLKKGMVKESRDNNGFQPSWPAQLPQWLRLPIDHALITKDLKVVVRQVGPNVGSDHLPFYLQILLPSTP